MTEMVLNTDTLPEPLVRIIRTEKIKVRETGGIINLIPIGEPAKRQRSEFIGLFEGQVWMSDDFDEPLEDMKEYM